MAAAASSLEVRFTTLEAKIDKLLSKCYEKGGGENGDGELEARLSQLELLLFRSPLEEFKLLDEHIASMLPKMMPRRNAYEPEVEASNKSAASRTTLPNCEHFDIGEKVAAEPEVSELPYVPAFPFRDCTSAVKGQESLSVKIKISESANVQCDESTNVKKAINESK